MDELVHHCLHELAFDGDLGKHVCLRDWFESVSCRIVSCPAQSGVFDTQPGLAEALTHFWPLSPTRVSPFAITRFCCQLLLQFT